MIGLYQSFKISISFITPCMVSFIANVQSREAYRQKVDFRENGGGGSRVQGFFLSLKWTVLMGAQLCDDSRNH